MRPEAAAEQLVPMLAAAARATHDRGLTADAITAMRDTGLLTLGAIDQQIAGTRILARACASSAWLAAHASEAHRRLAAMPAAATAVGDALAIAAPSVAGTAAPSGSLEVRVSGSWHWVPGAPHADWLVLSTPERDICVPAAIVQMTRVEHQGGLNGANLATVTMNDVRIPADHTVARGVDCAANAAPLGAIVGAAEGAFADYVTSTRKRVSATGGGAVAAHSQVQSRLAAAEAELDSAAALLARVLQELPLSTPKDHARLQRDGAVIAQRSLHVVTTLVHQMGALGLAEFNPVQRHYRDLRAMAVDPRVSADALIARGRELLGLPEPAATAAA